MKDNAAYKRDERERKKESGLKRVEIWAYPCDFNRIKTYAKIVTEETEIKKRN